MYINYGMIYSLSVFISCMLYFCQVCCSFAVCINFLCVFVISGGVFAACDVRFRVFAILYLIIDNIVYNLVDNVELREAADSTIASIPLELDLRSFRCLSSERHADSFVTENCCSKVSSFETKMKK